MSLFLLLDTKRKEKAAHENVDHINKLLSLHEENIQKGISINYENTRKLVTVFNGMDNLLSILLRCTNLELSEDQISDIQEILTDTSITNNRSPTTTELVLMDNISDALKLAAPTPTVTRVSSARLTVPDLNINIHQDELIDVELYNTTNDEPLPPLTQTRGRTRGKRSGTIHDDDEVPLIWRYCFARNNTFIHHIFGKILGQKIFNFLYSKWSVSIMIIFALLMPFGFEKWKFVPTTSLIQNIYHFTCVPLLFIYFFLHILSVNRKCFSLITKMFEFWIKILYGIQFIIAHVLYYESSYVFSINISIATMMAITLFSVWDGLQLKLWMKTLFGVGLSLYFTLFALYYNFMVDENESNHKILCITTDIQISAKQILASATQILAVFFWKQTMLSVFLRNKCSMIVIAPYIRWERNTNITLNTLKSQWSTANLFQLEKTDKNVPTEIEIPVPKQMEHNSNSTMQSTRKGIYRIKRNTSHPLLDVTMPMESKTPLPMRDTKSSGF